MRGWPALARTIRTRLLNVGGSNLGLDCPSKHIGCRGATIEWCRWRDCCGAARLALRAEATLQRLCAGARNSNHIVIGRGFELGLRLPPQARKVWGINNLVVPMEGLLRGLRPLGLRPELLRSSAFVRWRAQFEPVVYWAGGSNVPAEGAAFRTGLPGLSAHIGTR